MYEKIEKSDLIILGSPVYFSNVTARMKNFMDRLNCEYFNGKLHGKRVVVVGVGES
jgi:multimeric flavodoxin WrbA